MVRQFNIQWRVKEVLFHNFALSLRTQQLSIQSIFSFTYMATAAEGCDVTETGSSELCAHNLQRNPNHTPKQRPGFGFT